MVERVPGMVLPDQTLYLAPSHPQAAVAALTTQEQQAPEDRAVALEVGIQMPVVQETHLL
jgi:hypothetical protein